MSESSSGGNWEFSALVIVFGALFVGLKLSGQIAWSWWWVLSPFWIGPALVVVLLVIGALVLGVRSIVSKF